MSRIHSAATVCAFVFFLFGADCKAEDSGQKTAHWRFPLVVSYSNGFGDVTDYYEQRLDTSIDFFVPIGLAFSPYVEFDYSDATASAIGMQVGPLEIIYWEETTSSGSGSFSDSGTFLNFPAVFYYAQVFLPKKSVSPYVKVGVAYPLVSADGVDEVSAGLFAAAGVDFMRQKRVALGLEFAVDQSTVTFEPTFSLVHGNPVPQTEIEPIGFTASFRIVF